MKHPSPVSSVSRRDALLTFGASAVALATAFLPRRLGAAEQPPVPPAPDSPGAPTAPPAPTGPFTLPPLGYAFDALEPAIDAMTMEIHYTKHHQGYVNKANLAVQECAELQGKSAEEILRGFRTVPNGVRTAVRNNVGGHANHSLFWDILTPGGAMKPHGGLAGRMATDFGSVDGCLARISETALSLFGSGWAWLAVYNGKLSVFSTANQDSPLMDGATPILGLDVWEHAYYLRYQNRRADYVRAVIPLINWDRVGERFKATQA